MTQPSFAPIVESEQVRPASRIAAPGRWKQDRVAEVTSSKVTRARAMGSPGPDAGYAMLLADTVFADRVVLGPGESLHDALAAAAAIGSARAAMFGRAPVAGDIELALVALGCLGSPPADLAAARKSLFEGVAHDYGDRRALVDRIPASTLAMSLSSLIANLASWRELLGLEETGV